MKYVFIKELGKVVEKIDLEEEAKWIHIKYARGSFHKTAYILRNDQKVAQDTLEKFLRDCNASEEIIADLKNPLKKDVKSAEKNFQEFINFLIKTSSVHIMGAFALGLSIFAGYLLGARLDERLNNYPSFTVIGLMFGLVVGCLIGYVMMYKYLGILSKKQIKSLDKRKISPENVEWLVIEATLYDVQRAVRNYAADLPKGISRTILVKEDYSLDFQKLAPYLKGIPSKSFYMSKETYDIFEEKDKHIPPIMDTVQRAVNMFYRANEKYPLMPYDPMHRVNYYQLLQEHYLLEKPEIELYLTEYNGIITHIKPQKKRAGGY
ncbi:AtpZ/AtpI family protein [Bacillus marasmi]|uniref:AtpZ/AtpI family protein n=1 Tax=Bacillus marasmi TaxID=1926279 RepID=UPI0011C6F4E0|nr:AtpZ/AtpI family protein [Bacillus marasmi]